MGKLHYFTLLLLTILLAIVSGGIFDSIENKPGAKKKVAKHEPDYYLENFKATTMDTDGTPAYILTAGYLEHYPDDNSMHLTKPVFEHFENKQKAWQASSETAVYYQQKETIQLKGNVLFSEIINQPDKQPLILSANYLFFDIDKNILKSNYQVNLKQGNMSITSNKMRADLNKNRIRFSARTKTRYAY